MRRSLIQRPPELREEIERQPLIWSRWVTDSQDRQLGQRLFIDWAVWDSGPASSMAHWLEMRLLDAEFLGQMYDIPRGIATRISEIDSAIPVHWIQSLSLPAECGHPDLGGWWGFFDSEEITPFSFPGLVRHRHFIFSVDDRLRLTFQPSAPFFDSISWMRIRVVGIKGKTRYTDPLISTEDIDSWRLWVWEGAPLARLQWDPGEWSWPAVEPGKEPVEFFQYTVRMGRLLHTSQHYTIPTRMRAWLHEGLSHAFLTSFWACIWSVRVSRRISFFMWMIAHAGIAVGTWSAQMGFDATCGRCDWRLPESPRHCLWICPHAHHIWTAVCELLGRISVPEGYVTWGSVSWLLQFPGSHLFYEGEPADPVFMLSATGYHLGSLSMLPPTIHQCEPLAREPIFTTIASITLWCIWKARCSHILSAEPSPPSQTRTMIWSEIIHTLRSQWDSTAGCSRAAEDRRQQFLRHWGRSSVFFTQSAGVLSWRYAAPQWFILHTSFRPP